MYSLICGVGVAGRDASCTVQQLCSLIADGMKEPFNHFEAPWLGKFVAKSAPWFPQLGV